MCQEAQTSTLFMVKRLGLFSFSCICLQTIL